MDEELGSGISNEIIWRSRNYAVYNADVEGNDEPMKALGSKKRSFHILAHCTIHYCVLINGSTVN